jgi:hypothetical protein
MTQNISEQNGNFTFINSYPGTFSCDIKVNVKHTKYDYDGKECYHISYEYTFPDGQPSNIENPAHPFFNKNDQKHETTGVIVVKNDVTENLVKYLLLSDEELSKFTGTTTPMAYRRYMMLTLDMLWD